MPDLNESEEQNQHEKVHRLTDMVVTDVDIVDRAANGRRFLLFKREEPMADENNVEVATAENGEVIAVAVSEADSEAQTPNSDSASADAAKGGEASDVKKGEPQGEDSSQAEKQTDMKEEEEEDKKKEKDKEVCKAGIPGPVKDAVLSSLREGSERLMSVQAVLRSAKTTDEKMDNPLPNAIHKELKEIGALLSSLVQRYPAPAAKAEEEDEEEKDKDKEEAMKAADAHTAMLTEKLDAIGKLGSEISAGGLSPADLEAKMCQMRDIMWSVGEVASVVAVGKRDDSGDSEDVEKSEETQPELSSEEVITQILKQAGTLTVPTPVRDAVIAKVRDAVEAILSLTRKVNDMDATEEESDTPMPMDVANAVKSVVAELASVIEKYPSPSSKSDTVLTDLQHHFDGIKSIVANVMSSTAVVAPSETAEKSDEEDGGKTEDPVEKSDKPKEDDRLAALEKSIGEIQEALKGVVKPTKEIPASNSTEDDGQEPVEKGEKFVWPSDIAGEGNEE